MDIKVKLEDYFKENEYIDIGTKFFYSNTNDYYILSFGDEDKVNLINIKTGYRWAYMPSLIDKDLRTNKYIHRISKKCIYQLIDPCLRDKFCILLKQEVKLKKLNRFELVDLE